MMTNTREIAWLAGILEGEGNFRANTRTVSPVIRLKMTDKDVVDRVAALWGNKVGQRELPSGKIAYTTNVYGPQAVGWMMTVFTFMGDRRKAKIKKLIANWKASPYKQHRSRHSGLRS
jgi:hypothetical protein